MLVEVVALVLLVEMLLLLVAGQQAMAVMEPHLVYLVHLLPTLVVVEVVLMGQPLKEQAAQAVVALVAVMLEPPILVAVAVAVVLPCRLVVLVVLA